jgi:hypothetical protein
MEVVQDPVWQDGMFLLRKKRGFGAEYNVPLIPKHYTIEAYARHVQ